MRAVTISEASFEVREIADPIPAGDEVLVRVVASGINNADLVQRSGGYGRPRPEAHEIPGMELAGEVVGTGPLAHSLGPGDRVMALLAGGAHAELAKVSEALCVRIPESVDFHVAAGFMEAFITAHDALFTQCQVSIGDRVLVHGAAGGVGSAAVQLARSAGAKVTATVRSIANRERVADLGAAVIAPEDFPGSGLYDVIVELVGAENMPDNLRVLASDGRISVLSRSAGSSAEIDFSLLMAKRGRISASSLRFRSHQAKQVAVRLTKHHVVPLLAAGAVTVPVSAVFGLEDAPKAFDYFSQPGKFGKVLITPDQ
jgi:NADPH:quinone reductase-like Zn-dependent oxidoreductase